MHASKHDATSHHNKNDNNRGAEQQMLKKITIERYAGPPDAILRIGQILEY